MCCCRLAYFIALRLVFNLHDTRLIEGCTLLEDEDVRRIWSICAFDEMHCASGKCAFNQSPNHDSNPNTNPYPNSNPNPNPNSNPIPSLKFRLCICSCMSCRRNRTLPYQTNPEPYPDEMPRMYASWLNAHIWSNPLRISSNAQFAKWALQWWTNRMTINKHCGYSDCSPNRDKLLYGLRSEQVHTAMRTPEI